MSEVLFFVVGEVFLLFDLIVSVGLDLLLCYGFACVHCGLRCGLFTLRGDFAIGKVAVLYGVICLYLECASYGVSGINVFFLFCFVGVLMCCKVCWLRDCLRVILNCIRF